MKSYGESEATQLSHQRFFFRNEQNTLVRSGQAQAPHMPHAQFATDHDVFACACNFSIFSSMWQKNFLFLLDGFCLAAAKSSNSDFLFNYLSSMQDCCRSWMTGFSQVVPCNRPASIVTLRTLKCRWSLQLDSKT